MRNIISIANPNLFKKQAMRFCMNIFVVDPYLGRYAFWSAVHVSLNLCLAKC